MKLWHCADSRSLRPLWTMEEMGLDYELETMSFPPRFLHEGYKELNPIGTVPFFVDGDVQMTESSAIAHYLVETYGPTDIAVKPGEAAYGEYLNWLYRSDATLTFPLTIALRFKVMEPELGLQAAGDAYIKWFFARLRSVETALTDSEYLCGDKFTVADICIGFSLYLADTMDLAEGFKPNTSAYFERLKQRPAFIRATTAR